MTKIRRLQKSPKFLGWIPFGEPKPLLLNHVVPVSCQTTGIVEFHSVVIVTIVRDSTEHGNRLLSLVRTAQPITFYRQALFFPSTPNQQPKEQGIVKG